MKNYQRLENNHLILSLMSETDFKMVFPMMNRPEVLDTMVFDFPLNRDEIYPFFTESPQKAADGEGFSYIITHKESGDVAGMCILVDVNKERKNGELGYWINPLFRRQGIAYNACTLLINLAFAELGFHKIWAETFASNSASRELLKKLGFREVGILEKEVLKHGKWRDRVQYEIVAENRK